MTSDIELAKESWRNALKHYIYIKNETDQDYTIICDIIKSIQSQKLDEVLHATTSHEMLVISKNHRYDAKVDKIRVELDGSILRAEYFSAEKNYTDPECIECDINQYITILEGYIDKILRKK